MKNRVKKENDISFQRFFSVLRNEEKESERKRASERKKSNFSHSPLVPLSPLSLHSAFLPNVVINKLVDLFFGCRTKTLKRLNDLFFMVSWQFKLKSCTEQTYLLCIHIHLGYCCVPCHTHTPICIGLSCQPFTRPRLPRLRCAHC